MKQPRQLPGMTLCIQSRPLAAALACYPGFADDPKIAVISWAESAAPVAAQAGEQGHLLLVELEASTGAGPERENHLATLHWLQGVLRAYSGVRAIALSAFCDAESVVGALSQGASGYLVKDPEQDLEQQVELIAAGLRDLAAGRAPISSSVTHHLVAQLKQQLTENQPFVAAAPELNAQTQLSKRETEVLKLAAKGFTYAEMAALLELSVHTVSTHVRRIYSKFEVNSRGEAIYEASRQGLLQELTAA